MTGDDTEHLSRRGFILGSLASALTITAAGTTGVAVATEPRLRSTRDLVVPVMGNYRISNAATGCQVTVKVTSQARTIIANGLPNTTPGSFPNANCPNRISAQSYEYTLPTGPQRSGYTTFTLPQPFGIAVDGVLFDPLAAEYWNRDPASGWQYYALGGGVNLGMDRNHAHVQPTGAYHYHGIPDGLLSTLNPTQHSPLVGWAGDGFPIYVTYAYEDPANAKSRVRAMASSYRLKSGTRPSGPGGPYNGWFIEDYEYVAGSGDLDQANGRYGVTPEYPKGTYYYVLTTAFPSVPLMFAGPLAASFVKRGGPAGGAASGGAAPAPGGSPPAGRPPRPGGPPPRPS